MLRHRTGRPAVAAVAAAALAALLAGCGYGAHAQPAPSEPAVRATGPKLSADTVRIGYFPNITHGTALVGLQSGLFQKELGSTRIKAQYFNAGPAEIEALNAGSVDIGFIGPNSAVNGYVASHGTSLRIVGGAASGGVRLVVDPEKISSPDDLRGKRLATPQLGGTQDVALLHYLAGRGYRVDPVSGAGDVRVLRTKNKVVPQAYRSGAVDGAWVPEPTASELVALGGKVLLDEKSLWPDGAFATTSIIASQKFLSAHPDVVEAVLRGSLAANAFIEAEPARTKAAANLRIKADTGKELPPAVLDPAWAGIDFTDDPLAGSLRTGAGHAVAVGLLDEPDLAGIVDLTLLDKVLAAAGRPAADDAGLDAK
ncbi:ABC transporter substrate-binding protein [Streptomyces sp. OfavH-34-F]|uniref:ABC transporter substrate-binding protein n=1 Tax=Streptomyces sp. OfavH-34-F TaxID=2917760 RepID=UPI001EF1E6E7|nr:ABC transporter substrate-binding protein [Streptomyces sp. OfavH-34-F]MCG7525242.1 ABC transporter substrate-binding protein [Streptomyces sp. OfavH-34-F]